MREHNDPFFVLFWPSPSFGIPIVESRRIVVCFLG